jgi:hypothetical protein
MGLRDGHQTGTRAELVRALKDMATGWHLRGNDTMRDDAMDGADSLAAGASSVTHGHATYEVTES